MKRIALGLLLSLAATAPAAALTFPLVPDQVWLVMGSFEPGRQPDGNSLVWKGPDGLVVLDTGRHTEHLDEITAIADQTGLPVVAIVNSHWHLDHVSGNPALKARWPHAKVYASDAIDGALTGFLAKSAASSRDMLAKNEIPPEMVADVKGDLATIANGQALKPDIVIRQSQDAVLAGLPLQIHLAKDAATAGDIWISDPANILVAAGDLVTLPVPFLDTANPQGWSRALGEIADTPFAVLVPGHGERMSRDDFALYRTAFDRFIACAASQVEAAQCSEGWVRDAGRLLRPGEQAQARGMAGYYVVLLRKTG